MPTPATFRPPPMRFWNSCAVSRLLRGALCALLIAGSAAAQEAPSEGQAFDPALRDALLATVGDSTSFADRFEAEVWLLDMSTRLEKLLPDTRYRLDLLRKIHAESTLADLPPELVLSVIHVESRFDRFALSHAGARGMMQVMPFWKNEIGRSEDNLFDVDTNLRYGCTILKYYVDMERGNLQRGLARYNGSLGKAWYPNLVFKALSNTYYRQ